MAAHELVLAGDVAMHVVLQQFGAEPQRLSRVVEVGDSFTSEQSALRHETIDKLGVCFPVGVEVLQLAFQHFFVAWVGEMRLKYLDSVDESLDCVQVIDAGLGFLRHVERTELGLEEERVGRGEQLRRHYSFEVAEERHINLFI